MSRLVFPTLLLAGVYLLALGSADPWDAAGGLLLAAILVGTLRGFLFRSPPAPPASLPRRLALAVPLGIVTLREIVLGTWQVALVVLHLRPLASPGIVAVPIGERTPLGVAVTGLLATLAPGECLVDVDAKRRVMLIHVLDASNADAVRERHARLYERYQRPVLP